MNAQLQKQGLLNLVNQAETNFSSEEEFNGIYRLVYYFDSVGEEYLETEARRLKLPLDEMSSSERKNPSQYISRKLIEIMQFCIYKNVEKDPEDKKFLESMVYFFPVDQK